MQTQEHKEGRSESDRGAASSILTEGSDFAKKEGGLRVLTTAGVKKIAEALRRKRELAPAVEPVAVDVPPAPEEAPEWRPGAPREVAVEELDPGTKVFATARRHHFNPKLLGCEVEGKAGMVNVRVRDSSYYRQGETFAVMVNDVGEWEAEQHRKAPKYR